MVNNYILETLTDLQRRFLKKVSSNPFYRFTFQVCLNIQQLNDIRNVDTGQIKF